MLTFVVAAVFVLLALWHFYMAVAPTQGTSGAVPSVDGKALFMPSVAATVAVGLVLLSFSLLIAATGGLVPALLPQLVLSTLCYALALGLLARAIGEFKYLGFFKRVRGSRFARIDTLVYSPTCLLLAIAVAAIAFENGA